jgi:dCMP deaminase
MKKYDKVMMQTALVWAEQSYCERAKVGAVIAKDGRIISVGYNGTPSGLENKCEKEVDKELKTECCNVSYYELDNKLYCLNCNNEVGFVDYSGDVKRYVGRFNIVPVIKTDHSRVVHAEANAILFAAKNGISTNGCTLYVTLSPCSECAKMIIQAGIKRVVYLENYRNLDVLNLLREARIAVEQFEKNLL